MNMKMPLALQEEIISKPRKEYYLKNVHYPQYENTDEFCRYVWGNRPIYGKYVPDFQWKENHIYNKFYGQFFNTIYRKNITTKALSKILTDNKIKGRSKCKTKEDKIRMIFKNT